MNLALFGEQSLLIWAWLGCTAITLVGVMVGIDFGEIGLLAFIGFVAPIVAVIVRSFATIANA